jgi:hypothetical protein
MKFTIILAILLIFNLERFKAVKIFWTKIIATVEQYPVDTLRILDVKRTVNNVKIYIEVNLPTKKVKLYLLQLTPQEADALDLSASDIHYFGDQKAHVLEVDLIYTNSFLRSYLKLGKEENEADYFYRLENLTYGLEDTPEISSHFKEKVRYFFNDITEGSQAKEIQVFISQERNEILDKLSQEVNFGRNVDKLTKMYTFYSLLLLTNNDKINAPDLCKNFNELVKGYSDKYKPNFDPGWQNLKLFQKEFVRFLELYQKSRIDGTKNAEINDLINITIDEFSALISQNFNFIKKFRYGGMLELFRKFLNYKYEYYNDNKFAKDDQLFQYYKKFVEKIITKHVFYLGYKHDGILSCEERITIYNQIKELDIDPESYEFDVYEEPDVDYQFMPCKNEFYHFVKGKLNESITHVGFNQDIVGGGSDGFNPTILDFNYSREDRSSGRVPQGDCQYKKEKRQLRRLKK